MIGIDTTTFFSTVQDYLQEYVEDTLSGIFSIAGDPYEAFELLGESPGRFRVILQWAGEDPVGDHRSGLVDNSLAVIVSHNRGLSILKGENFSVKRADDPALMSLNADVRDHLRKLTLPEDTTEEWLRYGGTQPVIVEDYPLDAYRQLWQCRTALAESNPA